ncbi:SulP family inorganic anion transporter [uncultured Desulfobulbus sp.]|uniref:SulP family inorganic anion transporter n=1 Tax=uncultured Desulfobulbus sp. TaxID=239745 RepID=UPI0029C667F5|nr:SulP family inorganic anion transporter [uncultured Desulfobulbus sp.]
MVTQLAVRFFPFLAWFPLSIVILRGDLIAGIIGALVLVPKAMAYAQLSGLPLQFGLYTALVPAVLGALWGSSRQLATGPVAIVSLMTAAAVTPLAIPGSEEYIGLALLLTLMVGCVQLVLGVVKLGSAVNFVSHPVILGFMNAAALIIGLSQVDLLLGIPKGRSEFFLKDIWEMLGYLPLVHLPTLVMSVFSLALMLVVKKISTLAKPGVLIVVAVTTLLSALAGFEHNATGKITEIATPEAREMVKGYNDTAQRIDELSAGYTSLSTRLRQAEKEQGSRAAADLRYRLDLLDLDIKALEVENRSRLRGIRKLYFVRGKVEEGRAAVLYQMGQAPADLQTDGRQWHIKKIEKGDMKLIGGGDVVGTIPSGLPSFRLPAISIEGVLQLLSAALVIALVAFMESISMAKAMAGKAKQRVDPNQELIGQGIANIGGSFFQAYPACGSFTGSAINLQAGAKTGLAMVFNGFFVAVTLLFFTPLIHHLPKAVLAMIILLAVAGLVTPKAFKHTWKASRPDGIVALITFVVTMLAAPHLDKGIMIGAALAIGHYLYRTMAPRVAILGRHCDGTLRDTKVHPDLATSTRMVVIRFDGSLYFANVAHFEDAVLGAMADHREAKYLLVVGDAINSIDSSGEEMIHNMVAQLQQSGVEIVFSGLKKQVLDVMRATGLFGFVGEANIFATEDQALAAISLRLGDEAKCDALFCQP